MVVAVVVLDAEVQDEIVLDYDYEMVAVEEEEDELHFENSVDVDDDDLDDDDDDDDAADAEEDHLDLDDDYLDDDYLVNSGDNFLLSHQDHYFYYSLARFYQSPDHQPLHPSSPSSSPFDEAAMVKSLFALHVHDPELFPPLHPLHKIDPD